MAVKPHKNDHPLNGVSAFDLVLINRHIIGLQLFNKTWKYLAADANKSGTLTTLDIIEISQTHPRRVRFPAELSFLEVCDRRLFLDSLNPFNSACPASLVFDPEYMPGEMSFLGIKTGDVNGNAIPTPSPRPWKTESRQPCFSRISSLMPAKSSICPYVCRSPLPGSPASQPTMEPKSGL